MLRTYDKNPVCDCSQFNQIQIRLRVCKTVLSSAAFLIKMGTFFLFKLFYVNFFLLYDSLSSGISYTYIMQEGGWVMIEMHNIYPCISVFTEMNKLWSRKCIWLCLLFQILWKEAKDQIYII